MALSLKRASASRFSGEWSESNYNVLADGAVVGRTMRASAAPPSPLDSCSQSSAKFVILLPETSHSLYAAFFKDNSISHGAAPCVY
jgi:hypothetical protein